MRTKYLLLIVLLSFTGLAQATPEIQHWLTSNGARIYFVAAPELPIVDIQITFDAGAARDDGKDGLAVLTNGMLSEGAGQLDANAIAQRFDELGARFSNSAQQDMAVLSLRSLSEERYLQPASELVATILTQPSFPQDAFERERKRMLIGIERRKQSPDDQADEAFAKAVFGSHPYASLAGGQEETVKALTAADLSAFYDRYYVAKNAVVAVVGDLDRKGAEQLVNNLISRLPEGNAADPVPEVPALSEAKEVFIEHPSAQTHILVGQPGMRRGDPDYFALYVGNHMLGGSGLVSRLSNEIREKRGLSYSTYSYFIPMRENGPYTMGLQTRNESAQEALKVLRDELKAFVEKGPTDEELKASKMNITGGFPLRIASNRNIVGYIAMIGFYDLPLNYLDEFNAKVEAVTREDIMDAFKRRVNPDKMATVMVGQKKE